MLGESEVAEWLGVAEAFAETEAEPTRDASLVQASITPAVAAEEVEMQNLAVIA